jgi:hypothetical protein
MFPQKHTAIMLGYGRSDSKDYVFSCFFAAFLQRSNYCIRKMGAIDENEKQIRK